VRCPYCQADDDRVVDSRAAEQGAAIRRRRECGACGQRFSTYERAEQLAVTVRKRDGASEPFLRDKVEAGVLKATKNLEVDPDAVRRTVARVEARIRALGKREVDSEAVGAEVLAALRDLHEVAYVRFASVHEGFTSPQDFVRALAELERRSPPEADPPPTEPG
jgi:transcriptional repressor NrdR